MGWFTYRSYVNPSALDDLYNELKDTRDFDSPEDIYGIYSINSFEHRTNPLSLTAGQWLARIRHDEEFEKMSVSELRPYKFEGPVGDSVGVIDTFDGTALVIDEDSFNPQTFKVSMLESGEMLICSLLHFRDKHYLCGSLRITDNSSKSQKLAKDLKDDFYGLKEATADLLKSFTKATGGKHFVLVANTEEMLDFISVKMDYKIGKAFKMPDGMKNRRNIIIFPDPVGGLQTIPDMAAAINSKDNPYYDKTYAAKNGINFFCNQGAVSYRLACILQDDGLVPDAFMNSVDGIEHGREFLHRHGRYITDFFFSRCREYDFEPYYK